MSEFYLSNTNYNNIISLLISSFIIFLYFIFFFLPIFLKLISFVFSPPFIATSLLVIAFVTIFPGLVRDNNSIELSKREVNGNVLEKLQPKVDNVAVDDDEEEFFHSMESLEMNTNVFDENNPEEKVVQAVESSVIKIPNHGKGDLKEEKRFGDFLKELDEFESMKWDNREKSLATMNGSSMAREESRVSEDKDVDDNPSKIKKAHSQRQSVKAIVEFLNNGGGYASNARRSRSMENEIRGYGLSKKEKEWNRTLAGKLFEERHHSNVEGSEGMDLLWETYEMESSKGNRKKKDSKLKGKVENYVNDDDGDGGDDDEDEEIEGPMCCLQAFKFSAGKMNMGVGRRSLVRFSKAVRGFGWLHNVSKQRKKVYNGDTFQFE